MQFPATVSNYVDTLHRVHRDNYTLRYFAEDPDANVRSTMYITPFVHQFFIYNSLYQVDWPASIRSGTLAFLPDRGEERNQSKFEAFMRDGLRPIPEAINRAFADIEALSITGQWTAIVPDARVTNEQGLQFFADLREFQSILRGLRKFGKPEHVAQVFASVAKLRPFVYRVRCNIFHGRKSLAEAVESNQNKRIELYYRFVYGLVTMFFIAAEV